MSDLIVMVYPTVARAEVVRQRLIELQKEHLIALDDAVIVTKAESAWIRLDHLISTTAGATSGSFWALFIGLLFLGSVDGAVAAGASCKLRGALTEVGLNNAFANKLAARLQPGTAGLFLLIKLMTTDSFLREIESFGCAVPKTSIDESKDQVLRDALRLTEAAETGGAARTALKHQ
ncbi:DUF1269 domain-containing protein [Mesorhizobium sp. BAC0120]|uniref:DUF1269 domain-containing protein n=1 Tax=Mesorhizobium sp. BAC0120 TaxID=3090670 RepID=UPI00298BE225|nr:DUF1269 domain-containing protein [Mesorhizobium sp. BAC0120]MDW6024232.1 DUF1269 domain-containing protein [Mesorhizobium sp. BAC0120]